MKKRFLSVLLTLFMVLMMLPTTAYADTAYCDICGKEVDIDYSNYEYLNAQFHQRSGYCQECGSFVAKPRSEHNWSGTATCTSGQTCTVCGGTSNPRGHAYESTVTIEPTCTTDGVRTYVCKNDSSHTYTEPIPAAGHNLEKAEKKDAGCTKDGYEAYWRCQTCKKLFSDEAGTVEIINPIEIKATGHDLKAVKRKEAGCTEDGHETYWRCQTCKKLFSDEAGTVEISNPTAIKATGHNLKKVEKKDATATEEGNSTYWFCDKCNKYFSDAKAETEIKKEDTVLAKLSTVNKKETEASSAKTANATKVTSTTDKTTKSSPKTGDSTDVQLYVILMLVSIGAAAGAGAKRKLKTQR